MLFKVKISFFAIQYVLPPTPFNKETRADTNPWWLAMADRLVILSLNCLLILISHLQWEV